MSGLMSELQTLKVILSCPAVWRNLRQKQRARLDAFTKNRVRLSGFGETQRFLS
jgi:hypothetical protein